MKNCCCHIIDPSASLTSSPFKYERDKCRTDGDHARRRRRLDPVVLRFSVSYKISRDGIAPPRDATNKRHRTFLSTTRSPRRPLRHRIYFPVSGGSLRPIIRRDSPSFSGKRSHVFLFLLLFPLWFPRIVVNFPNNEVSSAPRGLGLSRKRTTINPALRFNESRSRHD